MPRAALAPGPAACIAADDAVMPKFTRPEIASVMVGLVLALFLANLDQTIVATSLTTMARDLDGWQLMPWVVSAYLITSTTTTPIYGRLSDLYGRRPILLIALGLFVGTSVLCALAQTMPQLVAARLIQGVGGGGLRSVAQAVVADMIPPRERGRYQGYFAGTFAVSTALGPVLGGFFAEYLSWHWIFWINVPLGLVAFVLSNYRLKRLRKPGGHPVIDWLGAVLILASATPLLLAVGRVEQAGGWDKPEVLLPLALGLVALGLLILREYAAREPMIPLPLFRNRMFSLACTASALCNMIMTALIVIVPINYQFAGIAPNASGIRLIPITVGMATASFFVGHRVSRSGRSRIYPIIGGVALILALLVTARIGLGHSLLFDIICTSALGLSFGHQFNPLTVMVQNTLELRDIGVGVSCLTFFRLIAGAFGVALFTTVLIGRLNAGMLDIPGHEALGLAPGLALLHLDSATGGLTPALVAGLPGVVSRAFAELYLVMAGLSVVNLLCMLGLREVPLRGYDTKDEAE
jgi:EmrB/QacA subfamily drug resistance transporter